MQQYLTFTVTVTENQSIYFLALMIYNRTDIHRTIKHKPLSLTD